MTKKRYLEGNFFEGYSLLGLVCGLPDFRVTHFINQYGSFDFKKYRNFSLSQENETSFSWYYFSYEELRHDYYLIQNKADTAMLMPELRDFDYLLLMYGNITAQYIDQLITSLRKIPYVTAVFELNLNKLKNGDLFIEKNELHSVKQRDAII